MPTTRIHLISSPRNISTALMYSFAQRADTTVVDEPFYAYYLSHTGIHHPGREEILASMSPDAAVVQQRVILGSCPTPVLFLKDMAHHLIDMDLDFLQAVSNVFLIRDPRQLIASFAQVISAPTMRDIGVARQHELFQEAGEGALVLDSGEILKNPEGVLRQLCARLGLDFDLAMLGWEAGPRPEDGVWAPYWYSNVHRSTGFAKQKTSTRPFPARLEPLYTEALPYYEALYQHAIKA